MLLFHGSDVVVKHPLVNYGKNDHDFGQAFYLTTSYSQAHKWAKHKFRRNGYINKPVVTIFEFKEKNLSLLKVDKFASPSIDWLQYIIKNRKSSKEIIEQDFDLVIGPVIDGKYSWSTLKEFSKGRISFAVALKYLKPENLDNQWAFKTQKAVSKLKFRGIKNASD